MAEAKKVEKEVEKPARPSGSKVKVKNISKKTLNLANGQIEAGKSGEATVAELLNLGKVLKEV